MQNNNSFPFPFPMVYIINKRERTERKQKMTNLMNKIGITEYEFTVTKEMTPNIYVFVHLIQPHAPEWI